MQLEIDASQMRVWVDTPPVAYELPDVEFRIERPDGTFARGSDFPSQAANFARNPKVISFVYVDRVDETGKECAFLATEFLLATEYGLVLRRSPADYAKVNWLRIERHKHSIEEKDARFYDGIPALRPRSRKARTSTSSQRIAKLADRFAHYDIASSVVVGPRRIVAFLDQFPDGLVDHMLNILEHIEFLDRTELSRFAADLNTAISDGRCVPLLQGYNKSAAHLCYFFGDQKDAPTPTTIESALAENTEITFFDDSLLSGKQARTVVQTWFGEAKDLEEDVATPLTAEQQAELRDRTVKFRFVYATSDGMANLLKLTQEVGLRASVEAAKTISTSKKMLDTILTTEDSKSLRDFLARIGGELLASTKGRSSPAKWTAERCQSYALGYGGLEQLLVFAYNTPTATLTPLWKGGLVGGVHWVPLFPRRGEELVELPTDDE